MDEVLGGDADAAVGLWLGPSTGKPRLSVYCPATYRSLVTEASSSGRGSICELNISSSSAKACSNGALRRAIFSDCLLNEGQPRQGQAAASIQLSISSGVAKAGLSNAWRRAIFGSVRL